MTADKGFAEVLARLHHNFECADRDLRGEIQSLDELESAERELGRTATVGMDRDIHMSQANWFISRLPGAWNPDVLRAALADDALEWLKVRDHFRTAPKLIAHQPHRDVASPTTEAGRALLDTYYPATNHAPSVKRTNLAESIRDIEQEAQAESSAQLAAVREALEGIANLAHLAWLDPPTVRTAFQLIEAKANTARALAAPSEQRNG